MMDNWLEPQISDIDPFHDSFWRNGIAEKILDLVQEMCTKGYKRPNAIIMPYESYKELKRQAIEQARTLFKDLDKIAGMKIIKSEDVTEMHVVYSEDFKED